MDTMKHKVDHITRSEHEVLVTSEDLLKWLRRKEGVEDNAKMTITVPSGGDYGGQTLDLDEVGGITVTWTSEVKE